MKHFLQRALGLLLAASFLQSCNIGGSNGDSTTGLVQLKTMDDALQYASDGIAMENSLSVRKIEKAVIDYGNKPGDVVVLDKAFAIQKEASQAKQFISNIRNEIIEATGGYMGQDPRMMYAGAGDVSITEGIMLGQQRGLGLQQEANRFIDDLNKIMSIKYSYVALDTKDDPRLVGLTNKNEDFATFHFKNAGMLRSMAEISQVEFEVVRAERAALLELAAMVGAADLKFNEPSVIVRPASNVIAAGTKYNAEIFLGVAATTVPVTIKCRGQQIMVDPNSKRGALTFTAMGGAYDREGVSRQKFDYTVTYKFKGEDVELKGVQEYQVKKPVFQLSGFPSRLLYRNCGNELNISIPDLGSTYNPSFSAQGADVIKNTEKGSVVLVPMAPVVKLKISSNGNYIGDVDFKTALIPKPRIEIMNNEKPVDEKMGVTISTLKNLTVKAVSDESFRAFFPKDARYRVSQWECTLVRGNKPIAVQKMTAETGNLTDIVKKASAGDRLMIEIKEVLRTNYLNKTEVVNLGTEITNVPLN